MSDVENAFLEAISVLAAAGQPGCAVVADALALWLIGGDELQLEDAIGVGRTWRSVRHRRKREQMIRRMGAELKGSMSARQKAVVIPRRLRGEPSAASVRRLLAVDQNNPRNKPPKLVDDRSQ